MKSDEMKETNRRILVPSFSFTLSLIPLPSLPIPFATPDVVLGRNNNFPKSDEIGRRGVAVLPSAGVSSGRVTAFIDCFKAVSMRDTFVYNDCVSSCYIDCLESRSLRDCYKLTPSSSAPCATKGLRDDDGRMKGTEGKSENAAVAIEKGGSKSFVAKGVR
ncbi:hypothetical protein V1477_000334 [Vespula maculifrons]|uniref:Uncharacterized protein n=1 Tax=Vespula maculifrons TaxID=7453 RepID=A0ABD2D1C6_VESMC